MTEKELTFADYQALAHQTALYPKEVGLAYCAIGLANEAGEVAGVYKKLLRDVPSREVTPEVLTKFIKEIGDTLWYISELCTQLHLSLDDVAKLNIEKLALRQQRGTLKGSGDDR